MSIVVSDTSPIRALDFLQRLEVLEALFGEVIVPPAVATELSRPTRWGPPVILSPHHFILVRSPTDTVAVNRWLQNLDAGESEALALAEELSADIVLIDEAAGRSAAQQAGFPVIGTLGILVRAKRDGLIDAVVPLMDRLQDDFDFFVSDALRQEVLRQCGE